jgi:predicted ATPase
MLLGRESECRLLDRLLAEARAGRGGALVLQGEPGIGKTALLDYTAAAASDFRVLRTVGNEAEMQLAFATLQQLCAPGFSGLEELPDPQRKALQVAFGLDSGATPDRLLVGLAVLALSSALAAERPLVCVVDDAQWLDRESTQAFAFIARRLANAAAVCALSWSGPARADTGFVPGTGTSSAGLVGVLAVALHPMSSRSPERATASRSTRDECVRPGCRPCAVRSGGR